MRRLTANFLMSGAPHCPYLVTALATLRRNWAGAVNVHAWPESYSIVKRICSDDRLDANAVESDFIDRKRNAQFIAKILLMRSLDCDIGLYFDADVLIARPIDELFTMAASASFCASQWNNWRTTGRMVSSRIRGLNQFPGIDQLLVERCLSEDWPSVNGGVFACRPSSPVLPAWHEWTLEARSLFIADEVVLHLMLPKFYPNQLCIACGGIYNCSPKHQPQTVQDEEVVIWHGHGDSFARPQKSMKGATMWTAEYNRCLAENIGGCRDFEPWWCGNKHLAANFTFDGEQIAMKELTNA